MADYISREAVVERIESWFPPNIPIEWEQPIRECLRAIKYTQAADVAEVVHGEWIVKSGRCSRGVDRRTVMCSICGNYLYLGGVNAGRGDANLCPNCGARMDGGTK